MGGVITSLIGLEAPIFCGALTWACIATAVPPLLHDQTQKYGGPIVLYPVPVWLRGVALTPTFIVTIFALIVSTTLLGMGALSSCGAVTWACIATAVPISSSTRPKYMEGVTCDSGISTVVPPYPSPGSNIPLSLLCF